MLPFTRRSTGGLENRFAGYASRYSPPRLRDEGTQLITSPILGTGKPSLMMNLARKPAAGG